MPTEILRKSYGFLANSNEIIWTSIRNDYGILIKLNWNSSEIIVKFLRNSWENHETQKFKWNWYEIQMKLLKKFLRESYEIQMKFLRNSKKMIWGFLWNCYALQMKWLRSYYEILMKS